MTWGGNWEGLAPALRKRIAADLGPQPSDTMVPAVELAIRRATAALIDTVLAYETAPNAVFRVSAQGSGAVDNSQETLQIQIEQNFNFVT